MRFGLHILLLACAGVAFGAETASAPAAAAPATASAVTIAAAPAEADIAAQQQAIRNLYKTDYANKDQAKRSELAQQLIQLSASGTPAERIALLREAIALAGGIGDLDLAHSAYDTMVQNWSVDADSELLAMYKALVVTTPDQAQGAASDLLAASESAINADHYTMAQKLADAANGFARKANDDALTTRIKTVATEAHDLGAEYYQITDKTDLLGNLSSAQETALGRFYAMSKCDWGKALPLLAQGDDAVLKKIAIDDQAATTGPEHDAIAERWIEYAKKVPAKQRPGLMRRALDHLTRASDASTGLAKAKLDKRIADLQSQAGKRSGPTLPAGVVLWLDGEPALDGTSIQDVGPHHLQLTTTGTYKLLREAHGGFLRSDACTITATLPEPIPTSGAFTVVFWLRVPAKELPNRNTFAEIGSNGFLMRDIGGSFSGFYSIGTPQQPWFPQTGGFKVQPGVWTHLGFGADFSAHTATIYADGVPYPAEGPHTPLAAPITTVGVIATRWGLFTGDFDEFGFFQRKLKDEEVKALSDAGRPGRH